MSIDLGKYLQLYFEESHEHLVTLEDGLRALRAASAAPGLAEDTARAAHSIKGASDAFGFDEISTLALAIETVLRRVVKQQATLDAACSNLCTDASALLRTALLQRQQGQMVDAAQIARMNERLAMVVTEHSSISQ